MRARRQMGRGGTAGGQRRLEWQENPGDTDMSRALKLSAIMSATTMAVALCGCAYAPGDPRANRGNPPAVTAARATAAGASEADRRVPAVPERDRVLFDYRYAASALRAGDYDEAKARLDDAIARIGGIITNDADAARARGLFNAES